MTRDLTLAIGSALFAAVIMTLGDFVWASQLLRHRMAYGLLHGAALCLALGLALGIALFGAWLAISVDNSKPAQRAALDRRREALLAKLADLERVRRTTNLSDERYLFRRERLVRDLEQVYGEIEALDEPVGGGEGVAA